MIPSHAERWYARGIKLTLAGALPLLTACGSSGSATTGAGGTSSNSASAGPTTGSSSSSSAGGATASSSGAGGSGGSSASTIGSSTSSGGGPLACGCNGMASCAVWQNVYITWYGYNDNSCGAESQHGCNDIANPGLGPKHHTGATEGAGTYDDPSTAAASDTTDQGHAFETSGGVTLTPGTLIYNPEVQQYFIFEDSCLECGDEYSCKLSPDDTDEPSPPAGCQAGSNLHIDFWMGPSDKAQPDSLQDCEDNATIGDTYAGAGVVIVNPPPGLPVKVGLLYSGDNSATGGCFTSHQVDGDACP